MLNVLIVDDNPVEREFLRFLLEEMRSVKVVGEAEDGQEALELISTLNLDIVFLDISMPKVDGMEVAKELIAARAKAFIVFVTVESKYAVEAFELDTIDYLLKPFDRSRLRKTMMRIKERMAAKAAIVREKKTNRFSFRVPKLFVRSEGEILVVNVPEIIFAEKDQGKQTIIHTLKGMYQSHKNLSEIEQELARFPNFLRVHKSYLINMDMVEKITPWGDSSYKVQFAKYPRDALISRKNANASDKGYISTFTLEMTLTLGPTPNRKMKLRQRVVLMSCQLFLGKKY